MEAAKLLGLNSVAGKLIGAPLDPEALKALDDFAYFRLRYLGRKSAPWQERAGYDVLRYLQTPHREYVIINCPPGSGKSTLFTHDIPVWMIARNRAIRIQVGSMTERQARMYVGRIKKTLERSTPLLADAEELAMGIAVDAVATMADDYGGFRPEGRSDIWAANALSVRRLDGIASDEKEATVSAWGQDSGILGGRYDLTIWDDLVDDKNTIITESRDKLKGWWEKNAVRRLEPGGVLILQGQRMAHNDLYRHCLDQTNLDETPKYRHIIYPAHDEDRCKLDHGLDAKPWPEGCLLDPYRIPWEGNDGLETIKHNDPRVYDIQYQQRDGDLVGGLVQPAWITGGVDSEGWQAPGCLDLERPMGVVPEHLTDGKGWSIITVDPSVTQWWGIIWWVYDPVTENRYIIDIVRRKLTQEQFFTMDLDDQMFSGALIDLHREAIMQRAPIQFVIFEQNAAQRWFLGQAIVHKWERMTGVRIVGHTTTINKADPKYGLMSIGGLFRQGHIRIPWGDPTSRIKANPLIQEAQIHPQSETTDLLMSTWFAKLAVERLYVPKALTQLRFPRPPSMHQAQRGLTAYRRGMSAWR